MDERPDQIIGHIEAQRDQLGRNLNELETRVRQSTDWRTYYDRNPMLMMGAALGGGLLLGSMVGSKTSHKSRYSGYSGKSRSKSSYSSSAMGLSSAGIGAAAAGSSWSQPSSSSSSASSRGSQSSRSASNQWNHVSETMDHIKTALIAFGMAKAKEFLGQAIPGIDQHLSEAAKKHQDQSHKQGSHQGSTTPAEHFADSGAFAQGSGGSQSTNWESDMYRSSGQFGDKASSSHTPGQSGTGDYYSGTKSNESSDAGHQNDPVPTHQY